MAVTGSAARAAQHLSDLYTQYAPALRAYARAKLFRHRARHATPPSDDYTAEDLVQDVFLRLLDTPADGDKASHSGAYIHAVARNLYIDRCRRQRVLMQYISDNDGSIHARHVDCASQAAAGWLDEARWRSRLAEYLKRLPAKLESVYQARFVQELSQADTAVRLGLTRRTVRTLERRLMSGAAKHMRHTGWLTLENP